jgi:DNA repair protein RadC
MIKHDFQSQTVRINQTLTVEQLFRLARETAAQYPALKPSMTSPGLVKDYCVSWLQNTPHEIFGVLFLDTQNRLLAAEAMFVGTVDSCAVHPREVLKRALALNAAAIICTHNHPSGYAEPSPADRLITDRLKSALALIDVRVLDHIVVGSEGQTVSLAERGWI